MRRSGWTTHLFRTLALTLAASLGAALASAGTAEAATPQSSSLSNDPSPAGCHIEFVTNPHLSGGVPGAIKVNAKSRCRIPVAENNFSVTLFSGDKPIFSS